MMPCSGLLPIHIEHANEMGTPGLHRTSIMLAVPRWPRTEARTLVISDEGGSDRRTAQTEPLSNRQAGGQILMPKRVFLSGPVVKFIIRPFDLYTESSGNRILTG